MSLVWSNVELKVKKTDRLILNGVSGEIRSGNLLGIMGPTGCGKTSLLNALAGRLVYSRKLSLSGTILYEGKPIDSIQAHKRSICFVAQDDHLFSHLTVRETLTLAAYFSLPTLRKKQAEIAAKVDRVIRELNLTLAADTLIGSSVRRGVSGGEYKRVLIGKELMKNPDRIFLDEPTSGLDAYQALSVMESLKELASLGKKKVAVVIHQPRSSVFDLLDQILLLVDGCVVYFGAVAAAVEYFHTRLGHTCPAHYNPADYFLDLLSLQTKTEPLLEQSQRRIQGFLTEWKMVQLEHLQSHEHSTNHEYVSVIEEEEKQPIEEQQTVQAQNTSQEGEVSPDTTAAADPDGSATTLRPEPVADDDNDADDVDEDADANGTDGAVGCGLIFRCFLKSARWTSDFGWLLWRACLDMWRNYAALGVRCATALFFAVLLSLLYQDLNNTQQSIQDRVGLLYFLLINLAFGPIFGVLNVFISEKQIVCREIASGWYATSAYFLARVLAELPQQTIITVCYGAVVYWSVQLNPLYDRFLLFLVTLVLTSYCGVVLGFFISAISPSLMIANAVGPAILIIFLLYGGFYINTESLPVGSEWVRNISFLYWAFQALVVNEFEGETFECNISSGQAPAACIRTGEQVILNLSFQDSDVVICIAVLIALVVLYAVLAYIGLLLNSVRFFRLDSSSAGSVNTAGRRLQIETGSEQADP